MRYRFVPNRRFEVQSWDGINFFSGNWRKVDLIVKLRKLEIAHTTKIQDRLGLLQYNSSIGSLHFLEGPF